MKRSPSPPCLARWPANPFCSAYQFATSHGDNGRPPDSLPRCISNKCINDEYDAWPEMHSLRRMLRTILHRECSSRCLQHEWITYADAIPKPRYSAAVNATLQSCAFLPSFFSVIPARTQVERRAAHRKPFGASYARSIGDRTHPPRHVISLFFQLSFLLCRAAPIFRPFLLSSTFSASYPATTLAHLPRFRTYLRDKRLFIAVHRAARVIKSAARGI